MPAATTAPAIRLAEWSKLWVACSKITVKAIDADAEDHQCEDQAGGGEVGTHDLS